MTKNIVLIGLMGSGKTTIGEFLSKKLCKDFVDTDFLIEKENDQTINEIFRLYGEKVFREKEAKIIKTVSNYSDKIISTGGGAVVKPINLENLKKNSVLFYLQASAEELYERIKNDENRPLLKSDDPLAILRELLEKRKASYCKADFIINTTNRTLDEIVDEIVEKYKNYEYSNSKC